MVKTQSMKGHMCGRGQDGGGKKTQLFLAKDLSQKLW